MRNFSEKIFLHFKNFFYGGPFFQNCIFCNKKAHNESSRLLLIHISINFKAPFPLILLHKGKEKKKRPSSISIKMCDDFVLSSSQYVFLGCFLKRNTTQLLLSLLLLLSMVLLEEQSI
jgi:hypothetical protein